MLTVKFAATPHKYYSNLDSVMQRRIATKLKEIAADPVNARLSYPLEASAKRSARVGGYRILLLVIESEKVLLVSDIGPRGQVYRNA